MKVRPIALEYSRIRRRWGCMAAPSQRESKTRTGLALVFELVCKNEQMNGTDMGRCIAWASDDGNA